MQENSAGAVVFRRSGDGVLYLLLHYEGGHWDFPKGNIEEGETPEQTTRREVEEETGIGDLSLAPGFKEEISYFLTRRGEKVHKTVVYFLGETREERVRLSSEHVGFAWLPYVEALARVTYENSKAVLRKATEAIAAHRA